MSFLANSNSTRIECVKRWDRNDCKILYPAVRMGEISSYRSSGDQKEDICIMLSRLCPEKKIELAINAFRSERLKDKRLIIAGYLARENINYYRYLISSIRDKPNVKILPNCSRSQVILLLLKSKVLLHTKPGEHFGIAIVEAMAAGCTPIVHASRGPLEIVDYGKYGFTYREIPEIPEIIDIAFSTTDYFKEKMKERAVQFDLKHFERKFLEILNS
jgi:alpha-1,2-mannosyltransferase